MKKRNIIVCILVLILILSMVAVISISLKKEDKIDPIPVNETDNIEKEINYTSEPIITNQSNENHSTAPVQTSESSENYTVEKSLNPL